MGRGRRGRRLTPAADALPLPTFLIIGAQKSATRWLRINLGAHPDIFTADAELRFFNRARLFKQGVDAYRAGFQGWAGEPIVGEATPAYLMPARRHQPEDVAARIQCTLPDVSLIALLRNPIDRAYSAFRHHMARGRIPSHADFRAVMADPRAEGPLGLVGGGLYAAGLEPYRRRFGDRLAVILMDEVVADPDAAYGRALAHVGAQGGFRPRGLARPRHRAAPPGTAPADGDGDPQPAPTAAERAALWPLFRDDVRRLEEQLGYSLRCWSPEGR